MDRFDENMQDLYPDSYKTLLRESKGVLTKWKDTLIFLGQMT